MLIQHGSPSTVRSGGWRVTGSPDRVAAAAVGCVRRPSRLPHHQDLEHPWLPGQTDLADARDQGLLLVGFVTALRRRELADGLVLTLPPSSSIGLPTPVPKPTKPATNSSDSSFPRAWQLQPPPL